MRSKQLSILFVCVFVLSTGVFAQRTVPSSAGGTDATIAAALTALAPGGGTIQVLNTYAEPGTVGIASMGPVTITSVASFGGTAVPGAMIGVLQVSSSQTVTVNGFTIGSTSAGVFVAGGSGLGVLTLENCDVVTPGSMVRGIDVQGSGVHLVLNNTNVHDNSSAGIFLGVPARVTLTSSTISNNVFGAIYVAAPGTTVTATNCVFTDNKTYGGVHTASPIANVRLEFTGCHFLGNGGPSSINGAIALTGLGSGNSLALANCEFTSNTAPSYGSVVKVSGAAVSVVNSVFCENTGPSLAPAGYPVAITVNDSVFSVVNSTFYKNRMPGTTPSPCLGVIASPAYSSISTGTLCNNIFSAHDYAIVTAGSGSSHAYYYLLNNLYDNVNPGTAGLYNVIGTSSYATVVQQGAVTGDPAFVNMGARDLHLAGSSAAAGAGATQTEADTFYGTGVVDVPSVDFDGVARPAGGPSIGAFEPVGSSTAAHKGWELLQ